MVAARNMELSGDVKEGDPCPHNDGGTMTLFLN